MPTIPAGPSTIQLRLSTGDAIAGTPAQLLALLSENSPVWNAAQGNFDFAINTVGTIDAFLVDASANLVILNVGLTLNENVTVANLKTIDGRDLSVDGAKLDGIEALADVTDYTNVAAALAAPDANLIFNEPGGDFDFRIEGDTSTHLFFTDAGNERVGVSNLSLAPTDGLLHLQTGSAGVVAANANADELVLESAGNGGLSILTPNANTAFINFGAPAGNNRGIIQYSHGTDRMFFSTTGVERLRLGADGITFNELGNDVDFRVESDTQPHKLFIDAGTNKLLTTPGTQTTDRAGIGGQLSINTTQVGTDADTNEKTLMSYSLPANSLINDGDGIEIIAWGQTSANTNLKTILVKWAGLPIFGQGPTAANNQFWYAIITIYRTAASAQDLYSPFGQWNGAGVPGSFTTDTEDLTTASLIEVIGENGTAVANDIICHGLQVKYISAPA